jgi:hypothetical protein
MDSFSERSTMVRGTLRIRKYALADKPKHSIAGLEELLT